jgi:hypothetical protein
MSTAGFCGEHHFTGKRMVKKQDNRAAGITIQPDIWLKWDQLSGAERILAVELHVSSYLLRVFFYPQPIRK